MNPISKVIKDVKDMWKSEISFRIQTILLILAVIGALWALYWNFRNPL